jgi:hypothetical protein
VRMRVPTALRLVAGSALAAALLLPSPAQARHVATPTIVVNFTPAGVVTVTLNGTPLGTTSGPPTSISAGYYSLLLNGPGDCINLPLFELSGPGVNIQDDMLGGEVDTHSMPTYLMPNSTYTWHLDKSQSTVYTFRTSSDIVGSAATGSSSSSSSSKNSKPTSQDIVGSESLPFRGALTGAVTASGRLSLSFKGKSITSLKAGRYTVSVVDRSSSNGFVVKGKRSSVAVTGMAFVGKRTAKLSLTAGKWSFGPSAGKTASSFFVLG